MRSLDSLMLGIARSPGRFLACCALRRACRQFPQVRRGTAVALGFILPNGADDCDFKIAMQMITTVAERTRSNRIGSSHHIVNADEQWGKGGKGSFDEDLLEHRRLFVLAKNPSEIPDHIAVALDGMVTVDPPSRSHIVAAGRICLAQEMSDEQSAELESMPLALVRLLLRRDQPIAQSIATMRDAAAALAARPPRNTRIEDLHGMGEAGIWARELATDLKDWREKRIGWADVDRGVLISGSSGVGKTTFAKALAASCDAHLVLGSIARWQARGHLGDTLKAMQAGFAEARANVPAILFLDEIDAVGSREAKRDHNSSYNDQLIAALLESLDGAESREGVVVVGACNHPNRLDPALLRPGRFDRHVRIPLPGATAREGILRHHLGDCLTDDDLTVIVSRSEGWSGATLERLVRDARRFARRARRPMTVGDLEAALPVRVALPDAVLRRIAVHEAGHAIVALGLGMTIESAKIEPEIGFEDGLTSLGGVQLAVSAFQIETARTLLDQICLFLAGLAAEDHVLGDRSAGGAGANGTDLHVATQLALRLEDSGLGEGLASTGGAGDQLLLNASQRVRDRVETILAQQMERAKAIIDLNSAAVAVVADALLSRRTIGGGEITSLLAGVRAEAPRERS